MRFLECPPNLSRYSVENTYQDEADIFFESPTEWLKAEFKPGSKLPRYLVFFDVLLPVSRPSVMSYSWPLLHEFKAITNASIQLMQTFVRMLGMIAQDTPLSSLHRHTWLVYTQSFSRSPWGHGSVNPDRTHCKQWRVHSFCWFLPNPFIQDLFLWHTSRKNL